MATNTAIEWTTHTFNPWRGCQKVAEGCRFCYAEVNYSVKMHGVKWGPHGNRVLTSPIYWKQPIKWNRDAERAGVRKRVFCASLADVFEQWDHKLHDWQGNLLHHCCQCGRRFVGSTAPSSSGAEYRRCECGEPNSDPCSWLTLNQVRRDLFALIDATPWLDWQLLTKRPENIRRMWSAVEVQSQQQADDRNERGELFRRNVWLGTSFSTQADADRNIPLLLKCRDLSPVLFGSAEPLIESVHLEPYFIREYEPTEDYAAHQGIDWLIVGGESGPHARPCDAALIRSLVQQCQAAKVPCFVKQVGTWPVENIYTTEPWVVRDPKGGNWSEWPEDLRVRQFPETAA